jgi:hypothetical protein
MVPPMFSSLVALLEPFLNSNLDGLEKDVEKAGSIDLDVLKSITKDVLASALSDMAFRSCGFSCR